MESHRYTLQKYKGIASRHTCPSCGKVRRLTRYVNIETGEYLADHVGRCDRETECGYHYKPKQFFIDNPNLSETFVQASDKRFAQTLSKPIESCQPSFIPQEFVHRSMIASADNHFFTFIKNRFGNDTLTQIRKRFFIGSSKHWPGATIFWQIDEQLNARTGHVMLYNPSSGKRVKEPFPHVTWAHSLLKNQLQIDFQLDQCLFGEHQVKHSISKEVVIVESEKTAIIASIYLPEYTWMASGGLSMLSAKRLNAIKNHPIILYPDLRALDKWEAKATESRKAGFRIIVSAILENLATPHDRTLGLDLADYLLRFEPTKTDLQRLTTKYQAINELVKRFDLTVL